ncbi:hypothetical protein [Streptomyces rochei]|uniref:hypothetical protein n=1 Tax=Streptomyces rochei TaxID=1928 RepID=UPI00378B039A
MTDEGEARNEFRNRASFWLGAAATIVALLAFFGVADIGDLQDALDASDSSEATPCERAYKAYDRLRSRDQEEDYIAVYRDYANDIRAVAEDTALGKPGRLKTHLEPDASFMDTYADISESGKPMLEGVVDQLRNARQGWMDICDTREEK